MRGFPACAAPCESGPRLPPAEETDQGRQTDMPCNLALLIANLRQFVFKGKQSASDNSEATDAATDRWGKRGRASMQRGRGAVCVW